MTVSTHVEQALAFRDVLQDPHTLGVVYGAIASLLDGAAYDALKDGARVPREEWLDHYYHVYAILDKAVQGEVLSDGDYVKEVEERRASHG
jgi:hypothetical protein